MKKESNYMLLRHLPRYPKGTIKAMRFWMDYLGEDEEGFKYLMKEGWFR